MRPDRQRTGGAYAETSEVELATGAEAESIGVKSGLDISQPNNLRFVVPVFRSVSFLAKSACFAARYPGIYLACHVVGARVRRVRGHSLGVRSGVHIPARARFSYPSHVLRPIMHATFRRYVDRRRASARSEIRDGGEARG